MTATDDLCARIRAGHANLYDAILILGGGAPPSPREQLPFVIARCQAAAAVRAAHPEGKRPVMFCLSGGTAHAPQLLSATGLPIWEATVSAAWLMDNCDIPAEALVLETSSYDTIGNAWYSRTGHTDIAGWRHLLIITSDFHLERTKAIFEWIFNIDPDVAGPPYKLDYLGTPDVALDDAAVAARAAREQQSAANVRNKLAPTYRSLREVHKFLTSNHDLYTASKLVERACAKPTASDDALLKSYGGHPRPVGPTADTVARRSLLPVVAIASATAGAAAAWCLCRRSRV